ncbi:MULTISPECIES: hypothetical protein [unclassified Dysgonomonas]|uniref:hypothetical protein n=1 Tax=unclassified Dysgonomonas TaxID=2630389 RepID=UPI002474C943|nr:MULTISPECIES: hypothetical protein [unclassified Dysgonomonas]
MFVVASLIRFDAAMLVLVVSCPVLYYPIHLKQKEGKLRNELLFLSLIVILPVVCKVTDHVIYKADKDWAHYKEYNYYRGKVNDNPSLNTIKGGHPNLIDVDYDLFDRFFIDENFWDLTTVKGMYEEIGELGIEKKIPHVYPNFDGYRIYILLLFLFLLGQIYLARRSSDKIILSLSFCLFLSALFYVSFTNLLKERVFLTALIGLFWVLFSAGGDVKKLKIEYFTYSFFIVFLFFFIQKMVVTRSNIDKLDLMDQNTLLNNVEIPEGEFLITYYDGLKLEKYSPYEISDKVGDTKILFSGWMAGTPFNREYFTSYKDIIDRNMIFIRNSNDLPQWSRKLKKSIKVHYGTEVEILVVYETSNCKIIKLISSDKNN